MKTFLRPLFLTMLCFCCWQLNAQIIIDNDVSPEIDVCGDPGTHSIEIINQTGSALQGVTIDVGFPTGVSYVLGSITESTSFNVAESNISDLSNIELSLDNVPSGDTIQFSYQVNVGFASIAYQNGGNVLRNTITVNHNGGSTSDQTTSYNILTPALSILSVSNSAASVLIGGSFTRDITIINGGNGKLSEFTLLDIHDANVSLIGTSVGTLDSQNQLVTLSGSDFSGIGNGDNFFDTNETIVITVTTEAVGCTSAEHEYKAYWGCDGSQSFSNSRFPFTTIQLFNPDLDISSTPTFDECVDGDADIQTLTITNDGNGVSFDTEITIALNTDMFSWIDASSFSYTIDGGNSVSLTATSTTAATTSGIYDCVSGTGSKSATFSLPNLQPDEVLVLSWDNYTCRTEYCGAIDLIGWNYEIDYVNGCGTQNYNSSKTPESTASKDFNFFYENPSDLRDNEEGTWTFIVSSASFDLPEGNNPYFEVVFDIPDGLQYLGNAGDLTYKLGATEWTASAITFDSGAKTLTAQYDLPIPFNLVQSQFDLKLSLDCAIPNVNGQASVGMQLFYAMDDDCSGNPYKLPLSCKQYPLTYLHCPGACTEGLSFQTFTMQRTSFGSPDNDEDGLADASGSLDLTKVKANRVMVGDTFSTVFTGEVITSGFYPSWSYGYAQSQLPNGNSLTALYATISVYDESTSTTLVCNDVPLSTVVNSDVMTMNIDWSPATLNTAGCTDFSGLTLESGDDITLTVYYKVSGNIGGTVEQIQATNDFYVSPSQNGAAFQCDDWAGNITMIGYFWFVDTSDWVNVRACSTTVSQSYYLSIGDCCSNYNGGNLFPFEYRNWGHVKQVRVEIPDDYAYVSASMSQKRTANTNGSVTENVSSISPTATLGNDYIFDLEVQHDGYGGTLNLSDDGFMGTVSIVLDPICSTNTAGTKKVYWYYTFEEEPILNGGGTTAEYDYGSPDRLKYRPAKFNITSPLPTQDVGTRTVTWDVDVKNSQNTPSPNTFLYPVAPNNNITVTQIYDVDGDSIIPLTSDFYRLGDLAKKENRNLQITANYTACDLDQLDLYVGYDCDGYPSDFASHTCGNSSGSLYLNPYPAEMQVRIDGTTFPAESCDPFVQIEIEIASVKLGYIDDIAVDVSVPSSGSLIWDAGSTEVLYPLSGSYTTISDPVINNYEYRITDADMDATIDANGLVGVTDVNANRVKLRFNIAMQSNFRPGEFITVAVSSKEMCGAGVPTIFLAYDPSQVFGRTENIGLDDLADTRALSWADYDGDGFVDLFMPSYTNGQGNFLYKNDGDGTFTKVSSGALVAETGVATGSTWADYDNDGDLDVFITQNIGDFNQLFRNNGDGTFVKIENDPIVSDNGYSHGAAWGDYDNDGFVDLFVADLFSSRFNLLYKNNGDGTFTDMNNSEIAQEASSSISGVWGDYDNDGDLDLFVSNRGENDANSLYENKGGGRFDKVSSGAIATDLGKSVGASWADYDNDGYLDLFVANAGGQNNFLYNNNGDGTFTKITSSVVTTDGGNSHGSVWTDTDNDGDQDLLVTNDQDEDNFLYTNDGDGTFTKVVNEITQDGGNSFATAVADYDNDGDIDIAIVNHSGGITYFYSNERGRCNGKACITLTGDGSNGSAVGARIKVLANVYGENLWQMREISSQSGGGLSAQSEMKTLIGVGDATVIDSLVIEWPSGFTQSYGSTTVDSCMVITEDAGSTVCGSIFHDKDANGTQGVTEVDLQGVEVVITPGNRVIYTDENGDFEIKLPPGTYTLSVNPDDGWSQVYPTSPTSYTVNVIGVGSTYCGNDFGLQPSCTTPDMKLDVINTTHRVGFYNLHNITYENKGGEAAKDVVVEVDFGPDMPLVESTIAWDTLIGTTYRWNLGQVEIGKKVSFIVKDSIPGDTPIGSTFDIEGGISTNSADCDTTNNDVFKTISFTGALDPNDILVDPEGFIKVDQELTYKIRFQNVGNQAVSNVEIVDELPPSLDLSTLILGSASHAYKFRIEEERTLVWDFENINLIDSVANEPESHGYVIFRIKPKAELEPGTTIPNTAAIYFDNNPPVITNTVENIIRTTEGVEQGDLFIFPNPMNNTAYFELIPLNSNLNEEIRSVTIYNIMGSKVYENFGLSGQQFRFDNDGLDPGYYFIEVISDEQNRYTGKMIIQR